MNKRGFLYQASPTLSSQFVSFFHSSPSPLDAGCENGCGKSHVSVWNNVVNWGTEWPTIARLSIIRKSTPRAPPRYNTPFCNRPSGIFLGCISPRKGKRSQWHILHLSTGINLRWKVSTDCSREKAVDARFIVFYFVCKLKLIGLFIRGIIRRVLNKTRTFRINGTLSLK